jgi:hypothetical protein
MGAICFPFVAFGILRAQWNHRRAAVSAMWPVAPGEVLRVSDPERV